MHSNFSCRFTITSSHTTNDDLLKDWAEVRSVTTDLLEELNVKVGDRARVLLKGFLSVFSFLRKYSIANLLLEKSTFPNYPVPRVLCVCVCSSIFSVQMCGVNFVSIYRNTREERSIWFEFAVGQFADVAENCQWIVRSDIRYRRISRQSLCWHSNGGKASEESVNTLMKTNL